MPKGIHDLPLNYDLTHGHEMQFRIHAPEGTDVSGYLPVGRGMMIDLVNEAGFNSIPHLDRTHRLNDGAVIRCRVSYGTQIIDIYPASSEVEERKPCMLIAAYYDDDDYYWGYFHPETYNYQDTLWVADEKGVFAGATEDLRDYGGVDWSSSDGLTVLTFGYYDQGRYNVHSYNTNIDNDVYQHGTVKCHTPASGGVLGVAIRENKIVIIGRTSKYNYIFKAWSAPLLADDADPNDYEWTILDNSYPFLQNDDFSFFNFNSSGGEAAATFYGSTDGTVSRCIVATLKDGIAGELEVEFDDSIQYSGLIMNVTGEYTGDKNRWGCAFYPGVRVITYSGEALYAVDYKGSERVYSVETWDYIQTEIYSGGYVPPWSTYPDPEYYTNPEFDITVAVIVEEGLDNGLSIGDVRDSVGKLIKIPIAGSTVGTNYIYHVHSNVYTGSGYPPFVVTGSGSGVSKDYIEHHIHGIDLRYNHAFWSTTQHTEYIDGPYYTDQLPMYAKTTDVTNYMEMSTAVSRKYKKEHDEQFISGDGTDSITIPCRGIPVVVSNRQKPHQLLIDESYMSACPSKALLTSFRYLVGNKETEAFDYNWWSKIYDADGKIISAYDASDLAGDQDAVPPIPPLVDPEIDNGHFEDISII